jgi:hypothetical protein
LTDEICCEIRLANNYKLMKDEENNMAFWVGDLAVADYWSGW